MSPMNQQRLQHVLGATADTMDPHQVITLRFALRQFVLK
jgi:hypothetical protein